MEVTVRWSGAEGVAEITYADANVDSVEAFEEWKARLTAGFERVLAEVGRPFPLVVDISNLTLSKRFSERYGNELASFVASKYASAIARYGPTGATTSVIAVDAMRRALQNEDPLALERRYGANLFVDRAAAVEFVLAVAEARAKR